MMRYGASHASFRFRSLYLLGYSLLCQNGFVLMDFHRCRLDVVCGLSDHL